MFPGDMLLLVPYQRPYSLKSKMADASHLEIQDARCQQDIVRDLCDLLTLKMGGYPQT